MPAIVTSADPNTTAGHAISLIYGGGVLMSEDREDSIEIDYSENAAFQMATDPSNNSLTPSAANLVSMYQTDTTAMRAIWRVSWYVDPQSAVRIAGVTFS